MPNIRKPRSGSLQFWPRKRAKRHYARVKCWATSNETKPLGFAGYKVGMTHIMLRDNRANSQTIGQIISMPVTVIECPPIKIASIRFYKKTTDGLKTISDLLSKKIDKELKRKINPSKKTTEEPKDFDELRVLAYTQPKLTGIGKKKPDLIEIGISGDDLNKKLSYAKELLEKEIKIANIFKEGQLLDIHSITKGKGFQGTVKRFGVKIKPHKSEKSRRGIGTLGAWTPKKVSWKVPQPGKMGYHLRTEHNKLNIKIGNKPDEINLKSGFPYYGLIKNDYLLLKGSISGPTKRPIILTEPIRPNKKLQTQVPEITYVSLGAKQ